MSHQPGTEPGRDPWRAVAHSRAHWQQCWAEACGSPGKQTWGCFPGSKSQSLSSGGLLHAHLGVWKGGRQGAGPKSSAFHSSPLCPGPAGCGQVLSDICLVAKSQSDNETRAKATGRRKRQQCGRRMGAMTRHVQEGPLPPHAPVCRRVPGHLALGQGVQLCGGDGSRFCPALQRQEAPQEQAGKHT